MVLDRRSDGCGTGAAVTATMSWPALAVLTLRDPKQAAGQIINMDLPRDVLWMAVAFVAAVNTILSAVSNMTFPVPAPLAGLVANPLIFFVVVVAGLLLTVYSIFWTGRMLGGQGEVSDLLALIVWLQVLRCVAQVAVLVALIAAPFLASLMVLIAGIATIWIFVNFVNVGLQLNSAMLAVTVVILGAVVLIIGLTIFLSAIGVSSIGVPPSV